MLEKTAVAVMVVVRYDAREIVWYMGAQMVMYERRRGVWCVCEEMYQRRMQQQ